MRQRIEVMAILVVRRESLLCFVVQQVQTVQVLILSFGQMLIIEVRRRRHIIILRIVSYLGYWVSGLLSHISTEPTVYRMGLKCDPNMPDRRLSMEIDFITT